MYWRWAGHRYYSSAIRLKIIWWSGVRKIDGSIPNLRWCLDDHPLDRVLCFRVCFFSHLVYSCLGCIIFPFLLPPTPSLLVSRKHWTVFGMGEAITRSFSRDRSLFRGHYSSCPDLPWYRLVQNIESWFAWPFNHLSRFAILHHLLYCVQLHLEVVESS